LQLAALDPGAVDGLEWSGVGCLDDDLVLPVAPLPSDVIPLDAEPSVWEFRDDCLE